MPNTVTSRLAHLIPCADKMSINRKCEFICNTLYYSSGQPLNIDEIIEMQETLLGIKMYIDDVEEGLGQLEQVGHVDRYDDKYSLSDEAKRSIENNRFDQNKLKDTVINKWVNERIKSNYPNFSPKDVDEIIQDLLKFLEDLFIYHGMQSINLLNNHKFEEFDVPTIISNLPERANRISNIRENEFRIFLGLGDDNVREFLHNYIQKTYIYMTVVCDPQILAVLKKRLKNKIIYFDSNTIYRLLGLQGEKRQNILKSVVSLCHEYELSLRIHNQTFHELKRRIKYDSDYLMKHSYDVELAKVAARHYHTVENYVTTFWDQSEKNGVTMEAFIERYNNFDLLLGEYHIIIEEEPTDLPDDFKKNVNELKAKLRKIKTRHDKSEKALEHDAYSLVLIELLCKGYYKFIDYPAWLLTSDSSVIKYYELKSNNESITPKEILPPHLIQLLQFTTTTTNLDYEQAYVNIFTKKFIKCEMLKNNISSGTIHEILGIINMHRGDKPDIAKKILSNTLLMKKYKNFENDEKMKYKLINSEIDELNEQRIRSIEDKYVNIEKNYDNISCSISNLSDTLAQSAITMADEFDSLLSEVITVKDKVSSLDNYKKEVSEALDNVNKQMRIIKSFSIIVLPAILFLYSLFTDGYYRISILIISLLAIMVSCLAIYHIYYSIKRDDVKKTASTIIKCLQYVLTATAASLTLFQYYINHFKH